MNVTFKTNLDIRHASEKWPEKLECRPMVDDIVRSSMKWRNGFQLELRVCRVILTETGIEAELTLIPSRYSCISDFNKHYNEITR